MTSGGARGRSGPAPSPDSLRNERNNAQEWVTLPSARLGAPPEWPLSIAASDAEKIHWAREWARPQATQWERNGLEVEVAIYVRSLAEAEIPGAAANLRNLVKQHQENLGLSLPGLARNRWIIPATGSTGTQPATGAKKSSAPRSARPSARDRFKVVPPPAPEPEDPAPF